MCEECYHDFMKIYQNEIKCQNSIIYISVSKKRPQKIVVYMHNVLQKYHLTTMEYSESVDCHYPEEKLYVCHKCGTGISSPLTPNQNPGYSLMTVKYMITPEEMSEKLASGELNTTNHLSRLFDYNVVNPKVIAGKDVLVFEDGWEDYLYWDVDWKVIPTIQY